MRTPHCPDCGLWMEPAGRLPRLSGHATWATFCCTPCGVVFTEDERPDPLPDRALSLRYASCEGTA